MAEKPGVPTEFTVRVTDDLALKVSAHRLNVARIVEAALRRQVFLREVCAACPDDLSATIARLRPQHDACHRRQTER
jgi:hypothetical protein